MHSSTRTPSPPLAGLNVQKTTLLLYPDRLCGTIERFHPASRTFTYETLDLPRAELQAVTLGGIAHTRRITLAWAFLIGSLLSMLLLLIAPRWTAILGTLLCALLFLLLRILIPIRLLRLQTPTTTYYIPIQWWERADTRAFLRAL